MKRMFGWFGGGVWLRKRPFAADDVGVHAGAADVLADLVDDEQVGLVERQPGEPFLRLDEQLLLDRLEVGGQRALRSGRSRRSRSRRSPRPKAIGALASIVRPTERTTGS